MKTQSYECPQCGEVEEVVGHLDDGIDIAETENGDIYEYVSIVCQCYKCGKRWTDYRRLVYDGYWDRASGAIYDADGREIISE